MSRFPALKSLPIVFALALAACAAEDPDPQAAATLPDVATDAGTAPPATDGDDVLPDGETPAPHWDGFGPARFGMEADAVRAAWPGDLGDNPMEEAACFHLSPADQPDLAHIAMMFGEGRLVRYSVSNDAMVAPGGGRRGMSDAEIDALYPGRVERQPHKYSDGQYLRIAGDGDRVLLFETDDGGTVTQWRVGVPPYVDYVEGCS